MASEVNDLKSACTVGVSEKVTERCFKGVLHPRPVFGLFMHFSQNLQHIGNK